MTICKVGIVGQAGFKSIELEFCAGLLEAHRRDLSKTQAILDEYGMRCASIMAVEEALFSLDPATKRKALADFDQLADLLARLGSPLVTIVVNCRPKSVPKERSCTSVAFVISDAG